MIRTPMRPDERGIAAVEFALVAPVFVLAMLGFFDLCYQSYVRSALVGATQSVARATTLENGATTAATNDQNVRELVQKVAPQAVLTFSRRSVSRFRDAEGEPFTDANDDGVRQAGECYDDVNGNAQWDSDVSQSGSGGADDIVIYRVRATFPRLMPLAGFLGWPNAEVDSTQTIMKNQPWASQANSTVVARCS